MFQNPFTTLIQFQQGSLIVNPDGIICVEMTDHIRPVIDGQIADRTSNLHPEMFAEIVIGPLTCAREHDEA